MGRQVHDWSQGQEHAVYLYIANSSNAFSDFEWLFVLWSQFVVPRSLLPWSETPSCSSLSSKWIFSLSPWEKMTVPSALKKLSCRSTPTAEQAWVQKECRARRCSPASGQQETKQLPCNGHGHRAHPDGDGPADCQKRKYKMAGAHEAGSAGPSILNPTAASVHRWRLTAPSQRRQPPHLTSSPHPRTAPQPRPKIPDRAESERACRGKQHGRARAMQRAHRPPAGGSRGEAAGAGAPGRERALPRAAAAAGRQGGGGHQRGPAEARGAREEGRGGGRWAAGEGADAGGADRAPEAEGGPQGGHGRPPRRALGHGRPERRARAHQHQDPPQ